MSNKFEIGAYIVLNDGIEAKDRREAYELFRERYPEAECPDYVGDKAVVGVCESSGNPIFEDDDYLSDSEGVTWLREFHDPEKEEGK